jgi:hypothetical protein
MLARASDEWLLATRWPRANRFRRETRAPVRPAVGLVLPTHSHASLGGGESLLCRHTGKGARPPLLRRMAALGRLLPVAFEAVSVRYRRNPVAAARPREGPLTD